MYSGDILKDSQTLGRYLFMAAVDNPKLTYHYTGNLYKFDSFMKDNTNNIQMNLWPFVDYLLHCLIALSFVWSNSNTGVWPSKIALKIKLAACGQDD
jgi:hypothetical protein